MRDYRLLLSWAVAAALILLGIVPAGAQSPIHVKRCMAVRPAGTVSGFTPGYYPAGVYYWRDAYGRRYLQPPVGDNPTLSIDYVNTAQKPARVVEFGLVAHDGHLLAQVRDAGTFSPGVEIKHSFGIDANAYPLGAWHCVVPFVQFTDSTTWLNPHLPPIAGDAQQGTR